MTLHAFIYPRASSKNDVLPQNHATIVTVNDTFKKSTSRGWLESSSNND